MRPRGAARRTKQGTAREDGAGGREVGSLCYLGIDRRRSRGDHLRSISPRNYGLRCTGEHRRGRYSSDGLHPTTPIERLIRQIDVVSVRTRLANPIFRRISHFRYSQKWSVAFLLGKTRLSVPLSPSRVEEMSTSEPSKVIHMRNLPEECNEMDIRSLCSQYGNVDRLNSPSPLEPQCREAHQQTKRIHRS